MPKIMPEPRFFSAALSVLILFASLTLPAQGVLGNSPTGSPTFGFIANGGISGGGAIAFAVNQDITISSVTVWLLAYTGLDMYGRQNQSFYASIDSDSVVSVGQGNYQHQPGAMVLNLIAPPPNDGSAAAFSFVNSNPTTVLKANTLYWLFIYENTGGSYNGNYYPQWISGSTPTGSGIYVGSESFWNFTFTPSSAVPAFNIVPVPEPGAPLLALIGGGALLLLRFFRAASKR